MRRLVHKASPMRGVGGGLSRRGFIAGGAGLIAASAARANLAATPLQTSGPFYPLFKPIDADADLTLLKGAPGPANGEVIDVSGRVLSVKGHAIPGAIVEIWQADSGGRYNHPLDIGGVKWDENFQGFGAVRTGADGAYRFRTIKPRFYDTGFGVRTPHIHFYVNIEDGGDLTTQMYFPGEALNENDFVRLRLPSVAEREAVTASKEPGDVPRFIFDVVMV